MKEITTNNDCRSFRRMTSKGDIMNKLVKKSVAAMTILSMMTLGLMLAGCGGGTDESVLRRHDEIVLCARAVVRAIKDEPGEEEYRP